MHNREGGCLSVCGLIYSTTSCYVVRSGWESNHHLPLSLSVLPSFLPSSSSRANVHIENKHGHSALDVAKNWGDDFIYAIVYAKAQTLPPVIKKGLYDSSISLCVY